MSEGLLSGHGAPDHLRVSLDTAAVLKGDFFSSSIDTSKLLLTP